MMQNAQAEAQRIGISLQDFIRMLMAMYFVNPTSGHVISRDQSLWENARKEIKIGQYIPVKNKKELHTYLKSITS